MSLCKEPVVVVAGMVECVAGTLTHFFPGFLSLTLSDRTSSRERLI